MNIKSEKKEKSTVIYLSGRFDADVSTSFKTVLLDLLEHGEFNYVVDLSEVSFLDSGGLGCLVASLRRVREKDGEIKIASLSNKVRNVFELTRMHRVFDIFDSSEMAAKSFQ